MTRKTLKINMFQIKILTTTFYFVSIFITEVVMVKIKFIEVDFLKSG